MPYHWGPSTRGPLWLACLTRCDASRVHPCGSTDQRALHSCPVESYCFVRTRHLLFTHPWVHARADCAFWLP